MTFLVACNRVVLQLESLSQFEKMCSYLCMMPRSQAPPTQLRKPGIIQLDIEKTWFRSLYLAIGNQMAQVLDTKHIFHAIGPI